MRLLAGLGEVRFQLVADTNDDVEAGVMTLAIAGTHLDTKLGTRTAVKHGGTRLLAHVDLCVERPLKFFVEVHSSVYLLVVRNLPSARWHLAARTPRVSPTVCDDGVAPLLRV